jgi:alpha-ribazole phosphatase
MTRFWLVRHGPTHSRAFAGWRDIRADLSDTAAIARLNAHLPADALLISSDLIRAIATADALATCRTRLPHDPALRELHFGDWDGMNFTEVSEKWPTLSRMYWEEPGTVAPPNGESWDQGAARMTAAVDALIGTHADIIIVAHFGTILTQVQRAMNISPHDALSYPIDNLSVTQITHNGIWSCGPINHKP